jgi:hypothetical protein
MLYAVLFVRLSVITMRLWGYSKFIVMKFEYDERD